MSDEKIQEKLNDLGMRPVVISIPEGIFDVAKNAADELNVEVSSWISAAIQMIDAGQKEHDNIKNTIMKQCAILDFVSMFGEKLSKLDDAEE